MSAPRRFHSGKLRRFRSIAIFTVLIVAGLLWIGSAQAVHDNGMFELDGNVVHNSATTLPYDWTSLFDASGNQLITPDPINGPLLGSAFVNDTDSVDTTYFAGGTKISDPVHAMTCGGPAANDKTSMDYVYTALVQVPASAPDNAGHQVLYLGIEKQAAGNGGDNAFGFWLFKNKNVGCSGSGSFTGAHTDGDLFIDGLFTNGGGASDVAVFRWNGDDTTGSIGSTPIFTGNVCGAVTGKDDVCAIANDGTIDAGPWRTSPTMAPDTFVEAGIDMTSLLGQNGGCFTTFLADSQASQSTISQPKDYASGQFNTCVPPIIGTTATPGGSSLPTGVANQHDVATISGVANRPAPTGTISFFLCNPSEVTAGCVTGGTQVGSPVTISSGSAMSANADASLTTAAGPYCWRAEYTPDTAGSNFYTTVSHTDSDSECFSVIASPKITTTQSEPSGSVGDVLNDTAHLSGGSNYDSLGSITFNLYGPNDPTCDGRPAYTETVDGINQDGDYSTSNVNFTADSAGTWNWTASFTGDSNNNPASSGCGDESVLINSADIRIAKTADAAKVSEGSPIGFTLTVFNAGGGDARGVTLSDTLPTNPGLSWSIDKQGSGWGENGCSISSGVLSCGPVTVPGGTTQTGSTFTVHITSATTAATGGDCPGSGTVNNTGSVTSSNDGSDQASASTCVQALVDLSVTKSGSPAEQTLGEGNITWTIVVKNNGPDADTGVTITDPMPAGNTFVSATTTQGTCTGGAVLTCNIGPMAAGASVTITLVTKPSVAGNQVNTVTVTGNRPEANTANNTASATVLVKPFTPPVPVVYCVAVSKVTPKQLFVGRKTTLTIHVTQHGKAKAGVRVLIKGPHFLTRTKRSNAKGVIKQTVKMKKAGAMIFTPIASKRCNTKRVGVTGVFTPPVTG